MISANPRLDDKRPNVLIAEDNETNMLLVKCIFENILPHAIVSEASNGLDAIELYKSTSPDIIFMDVRMPVKNGYEATVEIRKLDAQRNTPIIALTAGTLGERERCLQAGMDDYISKPIIQDSIKNAIHKWLHLLDPEIMNDHKIPIVLDEMDENVHFNKAELSNRLKNNEELVLTILEASKTGMEVCLEELHKHLTDKDFNSIMETAHKLKGMAMSACFKELAKHAADLEELTASQHAEMNKKMVEIDSEIKYIKTLI